MCLKNWCIAILLLSATGVLAQNTVIPTTTLAAQTANNSSAANSFTLQTNGNIGANNVSKVDVHSLLYPGATTKIYAHLLLWFGESNHMSIGYSSTDPAQIHAQITDMISRGIDGVIIDWYGPNNNIDQATKLVMAEAETHPGFTFAIMIDQGAIEWYSCSGCSPQQALVTDLQYIEQTYFPSPAYMTLEGRPVVTNFNVDLSFTVDWNQATAQLSTQPAYLFQNNNGFSHVLSEGSYSWVMPTTTDYGIGYLTSFYDAGMLLQNEETVGATYKGFNDSLASWGSNRIMGQQCGQTWLQTFSEVNNLYNSGKQLAALQLVTWNDYEEATEIESGIDTCVSVSAAVSGNSLQWSVNGDENTIDHFVAYISTDGQNLMALANAAPGIGSINLCSNPFANGTYTFFVQAVGKPSMTNRISAPVTATVSCLAAPAVATGLTLATNPSAMTITAGASADLTVSVAPQSGSFNSAVTLSCSGLPSNLKCSFSPAILTPGASTANSILTVAAGSAGTYHRQGQPLLFANWLVGFGMLGFVAIGKMQRGRLTRILGACALAALITGAFSCGGNSVSSPSSAGSPNSYLVTVNGNAGTLRVSTTVTVTVK